MTTQLLIGNMKLTCVNAGADNIFTGIGDETYMRGKGFDDLRGSNPLNPLSDGDFLNVIKSNGKNALQEPMQSGDTARVRFGGSASYDVGGGVNFKIFDQDPTSIFEGGLFPDDFIGSTSYTATGSEPVIGQTPLHFTRSISGNGSSYKFQFDVVRFSTSGKVASEKGGLMDGRNTAGTMVGLSGKDIINGNNGDDLILGGGNSDHLNGGNGDDVIFGGKGLDRSTGGNGNDTFVIARGSGFDTIQDFRVGKDHLGLADNLTFQDLSFSKWGRGTLVKAGNEKIAWMDGVNPNQLSASSFVQSDLAGINSLVSANLTTIRNS